MQKSILYVELINAPLLYYCNLCSIARFTFTMQWLAMNMIICELKRFDYDFKIPNQPLYI